MTHLTDFTLNPSQPFVEFAIRTDMIAPLIKIIAGLKLQQAEHRDRIEAKTEEYLQKAFDQHGHEEVILIELNMELDVKYLLMNFKSGQALSNKFSSSEIRSLELWKLEDLIKSLPEKYMGDQSFVNPSLKEKIDNNIGVTIDELKEEPELSISSGIESLDSSFLLFKNIHDIHTDAIDKDKFNSDNSLIVKTKYENYVDMEYVETVKLVYLNDEPFMILSQKGDDSAMETVINHEIFDCFIQKMRDCLEKTPLSLVNELKDNELFLFN